METKPAVCLNCNRPLEREELVRNGKVVDITYAHAFDPRGDVCPKMEPVPYDPENPPAYIVICDFCGTMGIEWDYDATNFRTFLGRDAHGRKHSFESVGKWGACGGCHEDIQAEEWGKMADRHISNSPPSASHRDDLIAYFKAFASHRRGDPKSAS